MFLFVMGFLVVDIFDCGVMVWVYVLMFEVVIVVVDVMNVVLLVVEVDFNGCFYDLVEVVVEVLVLNEQGVQLVIFVDLQDNFGVGGSFDMIGILCVLVVVDVLDVVLGLFYDLVVVVKVYVVGIGVMLILVLGGNVGLFDDWFFIVIVVVEKLLDGRLIILGLYYGMLVMDFGFLVCLCIGGICVVVVINCVQMVDFEMFWFLGIEFVICFIFVVKSVVYFCVVFQLIVGKLLIVIVFGVMWMWVMDWDWYYLFEGLCLMFGGFVFICVVVLI